jgi:hypothetical protein
MQKLIRLVSVRDRFEISVAVSILCDDYVKPPNSGSFDIKRGNLILDL